MLSGVDDVARITRLFPNAHLMRDFIAMLRAHRLNVFVEVPPWPLGSQVPETRLIVDPAQCPGSADAVGRVPGTDNFETAGWAWDATARQAFRRLVVLSEDRHVLGFGATVGARGEAAARVPGITHPFIGWAAYARTGGALSVYGQRQDGTLCRIDTIRTPGK